MTSYPVQVDVTSPATFDRIQIAVRLVLASVLGFIGITAGWVVCLLFGVLPLVAAIAISSISSERYLREVAPRLWNALTWLLQLSGYMMLLTDRFPTGEGDVQPQLRPTGTPTVSSALLRLVTSIPSGLVLALLWCASGLLWIVGAIEVLVHQRVTRSILGFQRGVLRWQARLVAYHASLVEEYPPFALDSEDEHHSTLAASGAS